MANFHIYYKTGWRWKLVADNNEPVAISEPYSTEAAAKRGAETVKRLAPSATVRS